MPYILKRFKNGYKVCKKTDTQTCFSNEPLPLEKAKKQKIAIQINDNEAKQDGLMGMAKPLTARLGGKVLLKKEIVDKFFPDSTDYETYIEPFVGGGSIFFYKDKDNHKEIISDIDPDIIDIFKGFQKYSAEEIANEVNGDYDRDDFKKIIEFKPRTDFQRFIRTFLISRLSYFARGKTFGKSRISSTFKGYKERLEDATILLDDYKDVIKKYDNKNAFIYLDPPYKESQTEFYYPAINLKELKQVLSRIKGKFLLSFPDIKEAKDMFKDDYNIYELSTKYTGRRQQGGQTIPAKEIVVTNYKPTMDGGAMPASSTLHKMAKESYRTSPITDIDNFELLESTPTLKLYRQGNTYVVAVRGTDTSDPDDIVADLFIPVGKLKDSKRYKKDLETLNNWKAKYPGGEWYGIGHSLGGAVLDEFLLDGYLQEGLSYNPAIAYTNLDKEIKNKRIYKSEDPLYKLVGKLDPKAEVRQTAPEDVKGWFNRSEHSIHRFEGGEKKNIPKDKKLYDEIKEEIYAKNPKHSLFRSAQIAKEYKRRGGEWETKKTDFGIRKWFKQQWVTLNDLYHKNQIVPCGSSDTIEKYGEYPLCRPLELAKKIGKEKIGKMLSKKKGPEPLQTKKILGTDRFNIKTTVKGFGKKSNKFVEQLDSIGLKPESYLKAVKHLAKESGYDPDKVELSQDGIHKVVYHSPEGLKRFGRVGYGDYIIWSYKEAKRKVPKGHADKKRNVFRKSHGAMSKIHNLGKYSPNELSINLLW